MTQLQLSKSLILIRGVQGSGKSTLASFYIEKGYKHFEADMWFHKDGTYKWFKEGLHAAHTWCQQSADDAMKEGHNVVVSNTFIKRKDLKPYMESAEKHGYVVQEIICKGRFQNIHGVDPAVVEQKMLEFQL